jgi:ABC-type lipoprotein export system ATPase subunit
MIRSLSFGFIFYSFNLFESNTIITQERISYAYKKFKLAEKKNSLATYAKVTAVILFIQTYQLIVYIKF